MDKKKILIGLGILAAAGIGFYFWNKSKKPAEVGATDNTRGAATGGVEGATRTSADDTTNTDNVPEKALEKAPLTTRKEKRKACGLRPLLKKRRALWQRCVDEGGIASFDGSDFEQFENDYVDFSGLDLDLY
jgi:hypothetical protein